MSGAQRWAVGARAIPRWLHPGAWWAWAAGMAVAASRTTNPLLLALLVAVTAAVVAARRPQAPWARSFGFFLRLGIAVIVIRVLVQVIFGAQIGTTVLFNLPEMGLPAWLAGVRLGGAVTAEAVLMALYDGMRLAAILICFGAANALASPRRLLKAVPTALYELGVSIVVAMTFTPLLVADIGRVQQARHLRGRPTRGTRAFAAVALPVLEGALERSVCLAAAMDARGYGRRGSATIIQQRASAALVLAAIVASVIGTYGLVSADAPAALGLPLIALGFGLAIIALISSGRHRLRTRYRPDRWWLPEWLVLGAGALVAMTFAVWSWWWPAPMATAVDPPAWPMLPLLPAVALAIALTPAFTAPPVPDTTR